MAKTPKKGDTNAVSKPGTEIEPKTGSKSKPDPKPASATTPPASGPAIGSEAESRIAQDSPGKSPDTSTAPAKPDAAPAAPAKAAPTSKTVPTTASATPNPKTAPAASAKSDTAKPAPKPETKRESKTSDSAAIKDAADTPPTAGIKPDAAKPVDAAPRPEPQPAQSGVGGMLIGGVLAALIGAAVIVFAQALGLVSFGGADEETLARIDQLEAELADAQSALSTAQDEVAALAEAEPDLSAVTDQMDSLRTDLDALSGTLDDTNQRLSDVAVQQIPEAELPAAISAAYDEQLGDLLATIDGRFEDMQGALDERLAELDATRSAASEAEAAAIAAAQLAEARAAFSVVSTALETGNAYAEPLQQVAELSGAEVPDPLSAHAEDGIPTLDALQDSFPDAARAALTVSSRSAAEDGELSAFQAFLRTQVGARSLEPREGNDPDAILSRAEAAVAAADLDTALTELQALPQEGQDAMSEWAAQATVRRDVLAAAEQLSEQLTTN
ncbi:hypothetical protein [Psychromarinibacter halotolerans]|uniref:Mitochondrial inner membrane protein n=1 Tax=Psychromarinibacter halotolerans TaxID=1775175 RepID=A0ABV7GKX5_9RHOB|nr:hypothetical protein [Psychromarinibacter halotolerans]MDF0597900.1 hypothetical protein [Psychromarinibacter halotolerans]